MNTKKKYILENKEKLRNSFIKVLENNGIDYAMKITGLDVKTFLEVVGDYNYTPEIVNLLLHYFFTKKDSSLIMDIGNFNLHFERFDDVLYWDYRRGNEKMDSMCTPFWQDEPRVPIESPYYTKDGEDYEIYNFKELKITHNFRSVDDVVDWFNHWYIPNVFKILNENLYRYRTEIT
jgi:hypothetical protein